MENGSIDMDGYLPRYYAAGIVIVPLYGSQ